MGCICVAGSNPNPGALLELRAVAAGADLAYAEGLIPIPEGVPHPVQHGRLQMFDAIPMECCVLATKCAEPVPFDCSPVLQRLFWRDFVIRLSLHGRLAARACTSPLTGARSWQDYPFSNALAIEPDTAARYVHAANDFHAFTLDLPEPESSALLANCRTWSDRGRLQTLETAGTPRRSRGPWPIRTLVLGGIYEPPNNELCFLRVFENLRGSGYLTWRTKLYEQCRTEDLRPNNVVIFGRPRYPGCDALMRECKSRGIGTIVMIDDNWIALGQEKERYKFLFGPGQPALETFLECMRLADLTIVYSAMVAEDIAPYAREVVQLAPYVDLKLYQRGAAERRRGLLVGYSGSERETPAFPALAGFAQRHDDVELLFLGPPLPPELRAIDPKRLHAAPYPVQL